MAADKKDIRKGTSEERQRQEVCSKQTNIKSHAMKQLLSDERSDNYATWKKTLFFQNLNGVKFSGLQLKLNTDLVLSQDNFDNFLRLIKSPKLKGPDIKYDPQYKQDIPLPNINYELEPNKYLPKKFLDTIHTILPGKRYIDSIKYLILYKNAKKKLDLNNPVLWFTCTGLFEENSGIEKYISEQIGRIKILTNFNFAHEKEIGINCPLQGDYINLEIKFFDVNSGFVKFINKKGETESHPKKEIALNIHLYKAGKIELAYGVKNIITNAEEFHSKIQERVKEFFDSFNDNAFLLRESAVAIPQVSVVDALENESKQKFNGAMLSSAIMPEALLEDKDPEFESTILPNRVTPISSATCFFSPPSIKFKARFLTMQKEGYQFSVKQQSEKILFLQCTNFPEDRDPKLILRDLNDLRVFLNAQMSKFEEKISLEWNKEKLILTIECDNSDLARGVIKLLNDILDGPIVDSSFTCTIS